LKRPLPYLALVATLVFIAVVRVNLLDMPLERDEGGFAYVATAALKGAPLYTELRITKLPGVYIVYGLFIELFGADPRGIHSGLLVFNLATIILLFFLARRLFDSDTAAVAAATYAILSVNPGVVGFAAHATQLMVLPALGGIYLLLGGLERRSRRLLFLAGLLFGAAFTIKQPAIHFMLFGGVTLLVHELRRTPREWRFLVGGGSVLVLGSVSLPALTVLVLLLRGHFGAFWYWTFEWLIQFAALPDLGQRARYFEYMFGVLVEGQTLLWILAGLGILTTIPRRLPFEAKIFPYLLLVFMFAAVCTGLHFYPHYFVMVFPPIALFVGLSVRNLNEWLLARFAKRWLAVLPLLLFLFAWMEVIHDQPSYFTRPDFVGIMRGLYGTNPFPESVEIGRFIRERREEGDKMVIFGSEPQIYFYSGCEAASGHIHVYSMVDGGPDNARLQSEMIEEVKADEPRFLLFVVNSSSWLNRISEIRLVDWMVEYVERHYDPIGVVDIFADHTVYKWNQDALGYKRRSSSAVYVFERRAGRAPRSAPPAWHNDVWGTRPR
jgi:hypothetical protein